MICDLCGEGYKYKDKSRKFPNGGFSEKCSCGFEYFICLSCFCDKFDKIEPSSNIVDDTLFNCKKCRRDNNIKTILNNGMGL